MFWLLLLLMIVPLQAHAAVWGLSQATGNDATCAANGTSCADFAGTPCKTFAKINAVLADNDYVCLKAGETYTQTGTATDRLLITENGVTVDRYGVGTNPHVDEPSLNASVDNFLAVLKTTGNTTTFQNLEITGDGLKGIQVGDSTHSPSGVVIDSVVVHGTTGRTGFLVHLVNAIDCVIQNSHLYDQVSIGAGGGAGLLFQGASNCLVQQNVFQWMDRQSVGNAGNTATMLVSNVTYRNNTILATGQDPQLYMSYGTRGNIATQNVILLKTNPSGTINTQAQGIIGVEYHPSFSPGGNPAVLDWKAKNNQLTYNIIGYGYSSAASLMLFKTENYPTGPANEEILFQNQVCNNTFVRTNTAHPTVGAFRINDSRDTPDFTDILGNAFCDNLLWESGATGNTFLVQAGMTSANINIYNNMVQASTFFGATTGTNLTQASVSPFVDYSPGLDSPIGNPVNLNLTACTEARTTSSSGKAVGALPPPALQSALIENATPTKLRLSYDTPFGTTLCDYTKSTLSGTHPVTACDIISDTVVEITFTNAATGGEQITVTTAQGFIETATIGCGTAACQAMTVQDCASCPLQAGTIRNSTFWVIESYPTTLGVTNNVMSTDPVVASCVVRADSPSTLRIMHTYNGAAPMLPASGVTGYTAKLAGNTWATNGACTRGVSPWVQTCPFTPAAVGGQTVSVTYTRASGNSTNSDAEEVVEITDFPCTNETGEAPPGTTPTRTQYRVQGYAMTTTGLGESLGSSNVAMPVGYNDHVALVFGLKIEDDNTPIQAYKVVCQDNGGTDYDPGDDFGAHALRYNHGSGPVTATVDARPWNQDPGTTFTPGVVRGTAGPYPTTVLSEDSDTVIVPILQVSPSATPGTQIACRLTLDVGTALDDYTPIVGTANITVTGAHGVWGN